MIIWIIYWFKENLEAADYNIYWKQSIILIMYTCIFYTSIYFEIIINFVRETIFFIRILTNILYEYRTISRAGDNGI